MNFLRGLSREFLLSVLLIVLAFTAGGVYLFKFKNQTRSNSQSNAVVRVLSYSSFVNQWGPGPEIAKLYKERYGVTVEFQDAGDAGLLLKKLELFPADLVLGLDFLSLPTARSARTWRLFRQRGAADDRWVEADFMAYDWAPVTFIYRKGEIEPPKALIDTLDQRFQNTIALEDPRTSTPGLLFFFWVLDEFGVDEGFKYLANLKPNVQSVSSSWSSAYGMFSQKQAKMAFSYLTSPVYHWTEEKKLEYQPAVFPEGHPVQIEFAGVPSTCVNCEEGEHLARFLLRPEIQKVIMEKNFMMPIIRSVTSNTPFDQLPHFEERHWKNLGDLMSKRDSLLERWRRLGM
jgi:thiamine transport system substrate-binding protein